MVHAHNYSYLGERGQEGCEFEASSGYLGRSCHEHKRVRNEVSGLPGMCDILGLVSDKKKEGERWKKENTHYVS